MNSLTEAIEKNALNRSTFNPVPDTVQDGCKLGEKVGPRSVPARVGCACSGWVSADFIRGSVEFLVVIVFSLGVYSRF